MYAVGGGGQLQQVISPGDSSIGAVAVDGTNQDGARYTYYPAVQTNDNNQAGMYLLNCHCQWICLTILIYLNPLNKWYLLNFVSFCLNHAKMLV